MPSPDGPQFPSPDDDALGQADEILEGAIQDQLGINIARIAFPQFADLPVLSAETARGLLQGANYDNSTTFPEGFDPSYFGMRNVDDPPTEEEEGTP